MAKPSSVLLPLMAALVLSGSNVAEPTDVSMEVEIQAGDQTAAELAQWAVDRFDEANLGLPAFVIRFPGPDLADCGGAAARAYYTRDPVEVLVCWNDGFIVLHELAHVWLAHNLPIERHEPFMAMRDGVTSWANREVAWESRGSEHAANVIAWGLTNDPHPISRTYPNNVTSMIDAFTFLTDIEPLHDGGPDVNYPDRSEYQHLPDAPPLESGR